MPSPPIGNLLDAGPHSPSLHVEVSHSITAWCSGLPNVSLPPLRLDALAPPEQWPIGHALKSWGAGADSGSPSIAAAGATTSVRPAHAADTASGSGTAAIHSVSRERSEGEGLTAVVAINITHITPWPVTQGLLRGAGGWGLA